MNTFQPARREQTNVLVSIAGPSGSGKTYSAILMARGLAGPDGKIALIDTENKRSRHYAKLAGGFDVKDLYQPFAPGRFVELIMAAAQAGYTVLVIDSDSHEWEGIGGVVDMAAAREASSGKPGLHCWAKPKLEHKKFVQTILQAPFHVICCSRAKEKFESARGRDGKTEIVSAGLVAVQEKDFIYEMTVGVMLNRNDNVPAIIKCPGEIRSAVDTGKPISIDTGAALKQWAEAGEQVDQAFEALYASARAVAEDPARVFDDWFKQLDRNDKALLKPCIADLQSIRRQAEREAEETAPDPQEPQDEPSPTGDDDPPAMPEPEPGNLKPETPRNHQKNPDAVLQQYREELEAATTVEALDNIETDFRPFIATMEPTYRQTADAMKDRHDQRLRNATVNEAEGPQQGALM